MQRWRERSMEDETSRAQPLGSLQLAPRFRRLQASYDQIELLGMGIWCRKQDSNL
jgi:hypothetical protein